MHYQYDETLARIGNAMREVREEQGLTLPKLEKLSRVSESSISKYELGKVAPGLLNLIALADALGVSLDDYIGRRLP